MGKNKEEKKLEKQDKKRLKAELKLDKKRLKTQPPSSSVGQEFAVSQEPPKVKGQGEPVPWYRDPAWVRAIIGIATLIVAIIALFVGFYW